MKHIIKYLFLIAITSNSYSQVIKASETFFQFNNLNNIYFKDINNTYDKFLGTWEYNNGPHNFKAIITKHTKVKMSYRNHTQYRDIINCDYVYKYNGIVVYSVVQPYQIINGKKIVSSINGHLIDNQNKLNLSYREPSTTVCERVRDGDLSLTFLPNSSLPQLQWDRTDQLRREVPSSSQRCPSGQFDASAYKIPANMILNKIN